jgi:hypothetical protein
LYFATCCGGFRHCRRENKSSIMNLQRKFAGVFRGLWRNPEFVKLWTSMTITSFGAQITNLALPLTAAVMLAATPMQMGVLVALETLPFALVSLHAGVLIDRVRKLPIVIASNIGRGVALLAIPVAAFAGVLSIEILFAVGFICGIQNVVGGAAYQVLLAQMAGRRRLVEVNAKIILGETSSALIGPGLAGLLIQVLTAPFAILIDAVSFLLSALMLRRVRARNDIPHPGPKASVGAEIREGLSLVWNNRTLLALAWLAGVVAGFAPHANRGADPVRDARAFIVSRGDRCRLHVRRPGLCARRGVCAAAVGALWHWTDHRPWLDHHRARLAGIRSDLRAGLGRNARTRLHDAAIRFRRSALCDQLSGVAAGDHARSAARTDDRDDALPDGRRGAIGIARWRRIGDRRGPACHAADDWSAGTRARRGSGTLVAAAPPPQVACGGRGLAPGA